MPHTPPRTTSTPAGEGDLFSIDTGRAHPARVQNYLAGGASNFAVDRAAAEALGAALPDGIETARVVIRALGSFIGRTVRHLAGEAGVRQFLNIGVAPPGRKKIHDAAQSAAPDVRFVYVGDDPVVLAEAHELRRGSPKGATSYIHASLTDVPMILEGAAETLELSDPIAVLLPGTLNFITDDHDAHGIVADLVEALAPGSYLVVSHASFDIPAAGVEEATACLNETLNVPWVMRSHDDITRFFDGTELLEPGLVPIDEWRPDDQGGTGVDRTGRRTPIYGGVGHKA